MRCLAVHALPPESPGVSDQTLYRWKKAYSRMLLSEAR
jgi:hypothetical protein